MTGIKLLAAAAFGTLITSSPMIAAAELNVAPDPWVSLAASLSGMGFVTWFAWYVVTCWIPRMQQRFDENLAKAFAEAKQSREDHVKAIERLSQAVEKMVANCTRWEKP